MATNKKRNAGKPQESSADYAVEMMPIDRLIPYANNPRRNEHAVAKVAGSIKEFGFRSPITVDKDMVIVAGHTRVLAAKELGIKMVPVHVMTVSAARIRAYRLADNRTAQEAEWDEEKLAIELAGLRDEDFDLDATGFDPDEIADLLDALTEEGLTEDDAVPEAQAEAITKPGDIWVCGNHRLLCGDATMLDDIEKLMDGQLADMVFTDPPYNVDYVGKTKKSLTIKNDNLGGNFYQLLFDSISNMLMVCKGALYICMSTRELHTLHNAFTAAGGKWSDFLIWAKNAFTLGGSDYQRQYEPILYGWKDGTKHYWCGARDQGDVLYFNRPTTNDLHPTMKPVALVERTIENSSKGRDIVLDCFGGSGTTMIAAEKTGRAARLLEIDPIYCDVIVRRWQEFTGKKAVHKETGKPFPADPKKHEDGDE